MSLTPEELKIQEQCDRWEDVEPRLNDPGCQEKGMKILSVTTGETLAEGNAYFLAHLGNLNEADVPYLLSTVSALREEVERLHKTLGQALAGSDLRVCDTACGFESQARDWYRCDYPEGETVYSGHRADTYPSHAPELAAYLRAQSEAKQAEQTATQPASTNQKEQI